MPILCLGFRTKTRIYGHYGVDYSLGLWYRAKIRVNVIYGVEARLELAEESRVHSLYGLDFRSEFIRVQI